MSARRELDRADALRAGAMLETGDRVVTPRGAGVVVFRRMRPPTFAEVDAFSVKLDGKDHAGAMFGAASVRWEGAAK